MKALLEVRQYCRLRDGCRRELAAILQTGQREQDAWTQEKHFQGPLSVQPLAGLARGKG